MKHSTQKSNKTPSKQGRIIPNGVKLESHEYETILFFTELGKDIELIKPSLTPKSKNADFFMDSLAWEMKCPLVNSQKATERIFYEASSQSHNIIIDLRHIKGVDKQPQATLISCFKRSRVIKKLKIITKQSQLLEFNK